MTDLDGLVGGAAYHANQPTNEGLHVSLAHDDHGRIYVGDPCPGHGVLGYGIVNPDGESTEVVFEPEWDPILLRQHLHTAARMVKHLLDHHRSNTLLTYMTLLDLCFHEGEGDVKPEVVQFVGDLSIGVGCELCDIIAPEEDETSHHAYLSVVAMLAKDLGERIDAMEVPE